MPEHISVHLSAQVLTLTPVLSISLLPVSQCNKPHWDIHGLPFVYTVPLPQSPLGLVQSSHCVVSCTCTCAYNIPLAISRLITYLWMYKCVLLYFKLTRVSFSFTTDPVSFSTPNNVIYHEYVGHDVTLICNVINHVELQWQLTDNTVISSNSKYQYQVRYKVIKDCSIFILTHLIFGNVVFDSVTISNITFSSVTFSKIKILN